MKFAVDRLEEMFAVLEDTISGEIRLIDKKLLPNNISDGVILKYENDKYSLDLEEEAKRRKILEEKLDKLKRKNKNDKES